jgi:hypothetical protein
VPGDFQNPVSRRVPYKCGAPRPAPSSSMVDLVTVPTPATVSRETLDDQRSAITGTVQGWPCIVVYCKRNRAGAMWLRVGCAPGLWSSFSPVTIDEYMEAIAAQGVKFAPGDELNRWVAHVTDRPGEAN